MYYVSYIIIDDHAVYFTHTRTHAHTHTHTHTHTQESNRSKLSDIFQFYFYSVRASNYKRLNWLWSICTVHITDIDVHPSMLYIILHVLHVEY